LPSRKRKSLESHDDGREKRPAVEPETAEPDDEIHQSIEVDMEPELSPRRGRTRERERFSTPAQEDDPDMAPPMSSSASESDSPVAWPSLDTLAHRTYARRPPPNKAPAKTPELGDSASDISSPPSLTHSPNYAPAAKTVPKKKTPPPEKKVTTADLTSLLPRRRRKASSLNSESNDPFDLDASEDDRYDISAPGNDEDEFSYAESRAARRRNGRQPASKTGANGKKQVADTGASNKKKRPVRTYGANDDDVAVVDEIVVGSGAEEVSEETEEPEEEEGQDELPEEETSQMMRERIGEELQQAAKKFKEVDKWELSFEEVTESSSPGPFAR
jgi:hypothetical protein